MQLVVGVAIVRDRRVLLARRAAPHRLAGRWEFPGGKVEPGERPEEAAVREIAEELRCTIAVTGWLTPTVTIRDGLRLRVCIAELAEGEPVPTEHDILRWVERHRLTELDLVHPDVPFAEELAGGLDLARPPSEGAPRHRAVFFDEDEARLAAARLVDGGFAATVARERYAGEDDDEDHPWAVGTDAPLAMLELLAEEYDGWVDAGDDLGDEPATGPIPLDLPTGPRTRHRAP